MSFQSPTKKASDRLHVHHDDEESREENPITHKSPSNVESTSSSKPKQPFDVSKLRLPLKTLTAATNCSHKSSDIAIPLSAPSRLNRPRRLSRDEKKRQQKHRGSQSARGQNPLSRVNKKSIPYTPRLDELPLSLRLHSNPLVLIQSLRRQKISNFNMFHIEPAIDNQPNKYLTKYAKRRQRIRESGDPFPGMPPLPGDLKIPVFVAKQFKYEKVANDIRKHKQHQYRLQHMTPHIDNRLPSNVQLYRRMRRQRLQNAQKKARTLHEKRLQSPLAKRPEPPTRKLPANLKKSVSQIRRESMMAKDNHRAQKKKKTKIEVVNYHQIKYVDEVEARCTKFSPSPKKANPNLLKMKSIKEQSRQPRASLVHALPCHFDEWK